jgi:hypothetical protein
MIGKLKKRCEFFFKKSNNKAPNIEHLLGEFYKALCSSIKNVYMHLLDECLQNKKLPLLMHTKSSHSSIKKLIERKL